MEATSKCHPICVVCPYSVEAVRAECLRQLINNISVDTALQYYSTADVCTENKLKDACTSFIAQPENRYTLRKSVHTINCLCHQCARAATSFVEPGQFGSCMHAHHGTVHVYSGMMNSMSARKCPCRTKSGSWNHSLD